jgi:hypothetical protein
VLTATKYSSLPLTEPTTPFGSPNTTICQRSSVSFQEEESRSGQVPGCTCHLQPIPLWSVQQHRGVLKPPERQDQAKQKGNCRWWIPSRPAINNRVGHACLTKTGILKQGICQLQIAHLLLASAVQQPAQILRLPGWIVPAWGQQAQVCL